MIFYKRIHIQCYTLKHKVFPILVTKRAWEKTSFLIVLIILVLVTLIGELPVRVQGV